MCIRDSDPTDPEQTNRPDSRTREVQAESVAYAVCPHYGLDTSEYSFGYVAAVSYTHLPLRSSAAASGTTR